MKKFKFTDIETLEKDYLDEQARMIKKSKKVEYRKSQRDRQDQREAARKKKRFERNFYSEEYEFFEPRGFKK